MLFFRHLHKNMLLIATALLAACSDLSDLDWNQGEEEMRLPWNGGVLILCEGNFNSGNSSLSYYNPESKTVENNVFSRANGRRLGDTGQSITIHGNRAYIAMENSGIVWGMNTKDFKVCGQITATAGTKIINPRYVHVVSEEKAYVTDLYSEYINIFNPKTFQYLGAIDVSQIKNNGYCSTEEMVQWQNEVFVNCWSYSNKILVIDTRTDAVRDVITLDSWQPKCLRMDKYGKLWVITDGGYSTESSSFGDAIPTLYRIDAASRTIEWKQQLPVSEANSQLAMNKTADTLYVMNNDIYRLCVNNMSWPSTPFFRAPIDADGKRHKLYGMDVNPTNSDLYIADAVDYRQPGVVYRVSSQGQSVDQFRVGLLPNHFAFLEGEAVIPDEEKADQTVEERMLAALVSTVFEFTPAPGHQVNGYKHTGDMIRDGASMQEACDTVLSHWRKQWMVSLGAQGGYVVAGFDHNVVNSHGDYDLTIKGNPYSYQSEPGIIWVSMDDNGNGLPDDPWYELKGSEYGTENETLNYAITYYKPTGPNQDIRWVDNQGGEGIVPRLNEWNEKPSYWQDWVVADVDAEGREYRTYYGSRLKDTHTYQNGYTMEPPFAWGYADNDGSDYFRLKTAIITTAMGHYKIDNAVTSDGEPANLPYINFVKVQTAQTGWSPNLGDISTEVYGIWDTHMLMKQ